MYTGIDSFKLFFKRDNLKHIESQKLLFFLSVKEYYNESNQNVLVINKLKFNIDPIATFRILTGWTWTGFFPA